MLALRVHSYVKDYYAENNISACMYKRWIEAEINRFGCELVFGSEMELQTSFVDMCVWTTITSQLYKSIPLKKDLKKLLPLYELSFVSTDF